MFCKIGDVELESEHSMKRPPLCSTLFESHPHMKLVTTPAGGGFHAVSHKLRKDIQLAGKLIQPQTKAVAQVRRALDITESLMKAGEMTGSVQVLQKKFDSFVLYFIFHC